MRSSVAFGLPWGLIGSPGSGLVALTITLQFPGPGEEEGGSCPYPQAASTSSTLSPDLTLRLVV